jgi:hypothetical protein
MYLLRNELLFNLFTAWGYVSRGDDYRLFPSSPETSLSYTRTQSA